jgi:hypothetical protein
MDGVTTLIVYAPMILLYGAFGVLMLMDAWKSRNSYGEEAFAAVMETLVGAGILICAYCAVLDVWFGG